MDTDAIVAAATAGFHQGGGGTAGRIRRTSLNQFIACAVAEKVAALRTASSFAERRGKADWDAFDRLMARTGGEPPRPGDEIEPPDA